MWYCVLTRVVQQLLQTLREQEVPEPFHLSLQLSDQFGVWIFVDHCVTADLFGTVSIPAATPEPAGQNLVHISFHLHRMRWTDRL